MIANPFEILEQELRDSKSALAALAEEVRLMREAQPIREYFGLEDFARIVGVEVSWFRTRPYLRPNWGRSDRPGSKPAWRLTTIRKWLEISLAEREEAWRNLPGKQKKALLGVA